MFFRASGYHGQLVNLHHRRRNPSPSSCWTAIWKNIDIIYTLLRVGESPEKCVLILSTVFRSHRAYSPSLLSSCLFADWLSPGSQSSPTLWSVLSGVTQHELHSEREVNNDRPSLVGVWRASILIPGGWDSEGRGLWLKTIIAPIITILKTQWPK